MIFNERTWRSREGLLLYARDYPGCDGPTRLPVVCIPGLTRNSRDFEDLAPSIAATGRRVLALDIRGRGRSDWCTDASGYALKHYNDDIVALFAASGIERAAFIGTSMGGIITASLAGFAPSLVAAVIINDIGPVIGAKGFARTAAEVGEDVAPRTWEDAAEFARRANQHALPDYGPAEWQRYARRLFREAVDGRITLDFDPAIGPALAEDSHAMRDMWPLFEELARGRPMLLVHGTESDILEPATVEELCRRVPSVQVCDVEGVGHSPTLSEQVAAQTLQRFLNAVD